MGVAPSRRSLARGGRLWMRFDRTSMASSLSGGRDLDQESAGRSDDPGFVGNGGQAHGRGRLLGIGQVKGDVLGDFAGDQIDHASVRFLEKQVLDLWSSQARPRAAGMSKRPSFSGRSTSGLPT